MSRLSALLALTVSLLPSLASAQDLDLDEDTSRGASRRRETVSSGVVREVVRGAYLKANAGTTIFIGQRAALLRPGTTLDLTFGYDVVDKPKASVAVEFNFDQALHNAKFTSYDQLDSGTLGPQRLIQGDIHTFGLGVGVEGSYYPTRRVGIGGHAGGGITFVPLLMNRQYYDEDVVTTWGGPEFRPPVHQGPKPMIYVGPTLEYYTKLSHFSIGIDADFVYVIGLDFGVRATGFFKYTF